MRRDRNSYTFYFLGITIIIGFPKVPHPVSSSLITLSHSTPRQPGARRHGAHYADKTINVHTHTDPGARAQRLTRHSHALPPVVTVAVGPTALHTCPERHDILQCVHGKTRVPVSSLYHSRQLTRHVEIPSCTSKASRGPHCIPQAKLHSHGTGSLRAPSPIPKAGRPAFSVDQPLSCMLADLVKCAPVPRKLPLSPRHQL